MCTFEEGRLRQLIASPAYARANAFEDDLAAIQAHKSRLVVNAVVNAAVNVLVSTLLTERWSKSLTDVMEAMAVGPHRSQKRNQPKTKVGAGPSCKASSLKMLYLVRTET